MSASKLLKDIDKVMQKEQSTYTLKKITDLTKSDLERLKSYANFYEKTDGCSQSGFLPMNQKIKDVLTVYGLWW